MDLGGSWCLLSLWLNPNVTVYVSPFCVNPPSLSFKTLRLQEGLYLNQGTLELHWTNNVHEVLLYIVLAIFIFQFVHPVGLFTLAPNPAICLRQQQWIGMMQETIASVLEVTWHQSTAQRRTRSSKVRCSLNVGNKGSSRACGWVPSKQYPEMKMAILGPYTLNTCFFLVLPPLPAPGYPQEG